jgi:hypothetical protein
VEIETHQEKFDGELCAPYLYHQGLRIAARNATELQPRTASWQTSSTADYIHPELGIMYVFGHHDVHNCALTFGKYDAGRIELSWVGLCDVFWNEEFGNNVPFECRCLASVSDR